MRFIGNIEAKTDSKGRVFLPACFRRILQTGGCDKVMLRKDVYQDWPPEPPPWQVPRRRITPWKAWPIP